MNVIKRIRKKMGLTQGELSKKLNVSQSTVAMWETGINKPRADKLPELAKIFGCSIDDLFESEQKETRPA